MKRTILLFSILVLLVSSCTKEFTEEERDAVEAVKEYNIALSQAFGDVNLKYMNSFATSNQINKLYPQFQALVVTRNKMVARQDSFSVKDVKFSTNAEGDEEAQVRTVEEWTYWWEQQATGVITKPKTNIEYKIQFNLKREKGRWKVDKLEEMK